MKRLLLFASALLLCVGSFTISAPQASASNQQHCVLNTGYGSWHHAYGVLVNGKCVPIGSSSNGHPTRTIDCGMDPWVKGGKHWDTARCGPAGTHPCNTAKRPPPFGADTMATQQQDAGGGWNTVEWFCSDEYNVWSITDTLREQVVRLIPTIGIGTTGPWSLVNIQTVLWADTGTTRSLGTATVTGFPVALRLRFAHATWDFGDGTHQTTSTPGAHYPDAGTCNTQDCPGYFGHTYSDTGAMTIRLSVDWYADYSLDGGRTWQPVTAAPLPGPTATHAMTVKQARGVLVPNPGDH